MLVGQILKIKPSGEIATIAPEATLGEAARQLSARRIGCLVVSADGARVQGMLSERDIVREIGRHGPAVLDQPVGAVMTRAVVTCRSEDRAADVATRMTEGRFRHMPVMEGERMTGLISIGDVVKARLSELAMEKEALEGMIMGH